MALTSIADIRGRQVLDSRGNPTVEAEVFHLASPDVSNTRKSHLVSPL